MRIVLRQFKDSVALRARRGKRRVSDGEAGLTLIEMLIVLVIIGIVAAMVVINVASRPDEARVSRVNIDVKTLSGALAMYRLDNGDYPTTAQGLKALHVPPNPPPPAWRPYVQDAPKDPWGNDYAYENLGGSFRITSLGRDGKPGGEGIDADIPKAQ